MKSPFPGMDPYIEGQGTLWEDFHHDLITDIKSAIAKALPQNYVIRSQYRAYVVLTESEGKKDQHPFVPDIGVASVLAEQPTPSGSIALAQPATDEEPQTMRAFVTEEYREGFLEIYEREPRWRLVTCIEVLSPSNKRPETPGWNQYLRKRQGLLLGEASLVEIDLLRGGTRLPMLDPWPNSPYTLLVARRENAPSCKVWQAHFTRTLPRIPIPLAGTDADIPLDLQPLVEGIYARSRYDFSIDYARPLSPPLSEGESAWLAERLRARS